MLLKKQILLFYTLILISAGVIIAAEKPIPTENAEKPAIKCCKLPKAKKTSQEAPPLYYITEGIFRLNA